MVMVLKQLTRYHNDQRLFLAIKEKISESNLAKHSISMDLFDRVSTVSASFVMNGNQLKSIEKKNDICEVISEEAKDSVYLS